MKKLLLIILVLLPLSCFDALTAMHDDLTTYVHGAQLARTVTVGPNISEFKSVCADGRGNVYTAGHIYGTSEYNFGNGVAVSGKVVGTSIVIVKYNYLGKAQWAKTAVTASSYSIFNSVSADSSGNVYAVGVINVNSYDFGNNVTATNPYSGSSIILVKYNSSGEAQWARTVAAGSNFSELKSVCVDSGGNIYAAGVIYSNAMFTFTTALGPVVTATGSYNGINVVLVKYNSSGIALWAKTVAAGTGDSVFNSVSADSGGNIYTAGSISGISPYSFGGTATATGTSSGSNIVLVKYNSSGDALWSKTTFSGTGTSDFSSVSVDSGGKVYAAGKIFDAVQYKFDNNVTAQASGSIGSHFVLVKYNSAGDPQWARTVTSGLSNSQFFSVSADGVGNVYAAGSINTTALYNFGNGVTVKAAGSNSLHVVLVKYNSAGDTQWAGTATTGPDSSVFNAVTADNNGDIYSAGYITNNGTYEFDNGVNAAGTSATNILLVKYR